MVSEVTREDIWEYYGGLEVVSSDKAIYEAFCEKAVDLNPSYEMSSLAEEWQRTNLSKEDFAKEKFDALVSEQLKTELAPHHKEQWASQIADGIEDFAG